MEVYSRTNEKEVEQKMKPRKQKERTEGCDYVVREGASLKSTLIYGDPPSLCRNSGQLEWTLQLFCFPFYPATGYMIIVWLPVNFTNLLGTTETRLFEMHSNFALTNHLQC